MFAVGTETPPQRSRGRELKFPSFIFPPFSKCLFIHLSPFKIHFFMITLKVNY